MPSLPTDVCLERLHHADHGVLATIGPDRHPHVVPVCFAVVGDHLAIPVDEIKPKTTAALQRNRNAVDTGRAALLVERWDADDWRRLWWVRAELAVVDLDAAAEDALAGALRARYEQYELTTFAALLTLRIERLTGWTAGD